MRFVPKKNADIRQMFRGCQRFAEERYLKSAMVVLLGEEVYLYEDRIQIEGDKIYFSFHAGKPIPPLNFAACWNCEELYPYHYITPCASSTSPPDSTYSFNLPPILFSISPSGAVHLMFDFFENDWMVGWGEGEAVIPQVKYGGKSYVETVNPGGEDNFSYGMNDDEIKKFIEPPEEKPIGKGIKRAR
uniref:Uncharacterized protein n=1 Tax=Paramoeba aestuarina TaxID=180227 RepID=A0A7S4PP49_9EUKA|mmetsp:Transcript_9957/g.15065  ORF Transcript_9957/g.15065 Transcript_9957/m.15065 type:complete len:188 (+) Transcript_9957:149-712(+)